jgi:hypothetical protein
VKKLLGISLGIMTALGGFRDLGQIVFTAQPARFRISTFVGHCHRTAGLIIYMEMCGRIAVVAHEPVFAIVRRRFGLDSDFLSWLLPICLT